MILFFVGYNVRGENAITGMPYRGVNALFLSYWAGELGYEDSRWCTYNQAQEKGWQVRKGEHGQKVEYWAYFDLKEKKLLSWSDAKKLLKADPDYEKNLQLRSRVYTVFNAEQIDGMPPMERNHTDIGALRGQRNRLLWNMELSYREEGSKALTSQLEYARSIREAVSGTGTLWGEKDADWVYRNLNWTIVREKSLRQQRAVVLKNLRRLRRMVTDCDKSVKKSVLYEYKQEMEAKRARLRKKYEANLAEAQRIQRQIEAQKQMKREAKRRVKSAERSPEYHI